MITIEWLAFIVYLLMLIIYSVKFIKIVQLKERTVITTLIIIMGFILFVYLFPITQETMYNIPILSIAIFLMIVVGVYIGDIGNNFFSIIKQLIFFRDNPLKKEIIEISLQKIKSSSVQDKIIGLSQLKEYYAEDVAFFGLCNAVESEKDESIKSLFVAYICQMNKKRGNSMERLIK